jgi:hypothetical protein
MLKNESMTSNNSPRSSSSENDANEDDENDDQEHNDECSASHESNSSIKSSDCSNSTSSLSSNADANQYLSRDPGEPSRTSHVDAIPLIRKRGRETETEIRSRVRIEAMETISAPNLYSHVRADLPRKSDAATSEKRPSHNTGNQDSSTLSDLTGLVLQQQQLLLNCLQGFQRSRDGASTHSAAPAIATNKSTSTQKTDSSNRPIGIPPLQLQPQHVQLLALLLANHERQQRQHHEHHHHQQQQQHPQQALNVANSASLDPNAQQLLSLLLNPPTAVATAPSPAAPAAPSVNNNDLSALLLHLSGGGQRPTVVAPPSPQPMMPPQQAPLTVMTSLIASLQQSLSSRNAAFATPVATMRPLDPYGAPASDVSSANVQQHISALLGQIVHAAASSAPAAAAPRPQPPPAQPGLQASGNNNLLLDFIRTTLQNANLPAVRQPPMEQQQQQQRTVLPALPPPASTAAANDAASQLLLQMYAQGLLLQAAPTSLLAATKDPKLKSEESKPTMVFQRVGIKTLPMAAATDKTQISAYQQLIREQLEYFVSDQEDVDYGVQGRKKRVYVCSMLTESTRFCFV